MRDTPRSAAARVGDKLRVRTVDIRDDSVVFIDQRALPHDEVYVTCSTWQQVAEAITTMTVRGAPAIGVAAAGALHLAARRAAAEHDERAAFLGALESAAEAVAATRPTAVNLGWAIAEMRAVWQRSPLPPREIAGALYERAVAIHDDDIDRCRRIGEHGAGLFKADDTILTHCNAGALATAGYGTALGVVRSAFARFRGISVIVDETRPWLQGARLTAWELKVEDIPFALISDNMSGYFISTGQVDGIVVGADRIAANGDTANKIGTYTLSVLAQAHGVPFYVAAPLSTVDATAGSGADIPIEVRAEDEVTSFDGTRVAPAGTRAYHPAFDVTPQANITAVVTEAGVLRAPLSETLAAALAGAST